MRIGLILSNKPTPHKSPRQYPEHGILKTYVETAVYMKLFDRNTARSELRLFGRRIILRISSVGMQIIS